MWRTYVYFLGCLEHKRFLLGLIQVFGFYNQCSTLSWQFYYHQWQNNLLNTRFVEKGSWDLVKNSFFSPRPRHTHTLFGQHSTVNCVKKVLTTIDSLKSNWLWPGNATITDQPTPSQRRDTVVLTHDCHANNYLQFYFFTAGALCLVDLCSNSHNVLSPDMLYITLAERSYKL